VGGGEEISIAVRKVPRQCPLVFLIAVFYLKLKSALQVCPYLTGNTLHLCYEPNTLTLSIGLWRWYINITIRILVIFHRPVLYLKLKSALKVCSYLTGNTLCLCYELNRLMLSIGLWWWYINITITILEINYRPVFYLKLKSALQVCPYLIGNTLHLCYEPNRLMLSIGLWRCYINITIRILGIARFGDWNLSQSSGGTYSVGTNRHSSYIFPYVLIAWCFKHEEIFIFRKPH
jgi:hypothetical protein